MLLLIVGLLLFFVPHSVAIAAPEWRERALLQWGEQLWKATYSVLSIAGFVLIIYGFGFARHAPVILYVPPAWLRHVTFVLMVPVFPLLFAAYLPGRIQTTMKHPMLVAVKIWATAHLLANGMLADVLLFGSFLVWAVFDRISVKRHPRAQSPRLPVSKFNDAIAVILGLLVYALFVSRLHASLIGVPLMTSGGP
jgi:uncharacterized membrane protein